MYLAVEGISDIFGVGRKWIGMFFLTSFASAAELFNRCAERFFCFLLRTKMDTRKRIKKGEGEKEKRGEIRENIKGVEGGEGVRNGNARKRNREGKQNF